MLWKGLIKLIEPHYPRCEVNRPTYPLMAMLRVHLMQKLFGYSDPTMEESLCETTILRQFPGLHLDPISDETTILNFRLLLEQHELAGGILQVINGYSVTCCYVKAPKTIRRSFMRRVRRRTRTARVTRKCARRRKESIFLLDENARRCRY